MDGVLAVIWMFGGNFAPRNWALCQGQLLPISQNTALFSLLGTIYGGDGRTTFQLPDFRGRMAIGDGNGPGLSNRNIGQIGGQESVILNPTQMPSHSHVATTNVQVGVNNAAGDEGNASGQIIANHTGGFSEDLSAGSFLGGASGTTTVQNTGGNLSHNNMPPYLVVNYVICLAGLFPSRN